LSSEAAFITFFESTAKFKHSERTITNQNYIYSETENIRIQDAIQFRTFCL
jgi:hypothetical protein